MGDRIGNDDLTAAHLPPPDANWNQMGSFASSYAGYNHWVSHAECVEVANNASEFYEKLGELPGSLDELRTCLFVEYQRYLDFGWTPDEKRMPYLRAVVEAIRRHASSPRLRSCGKTWSSRPRLRKAIGAAEGGCATETGYRRRPIQPTTTQPSNRPPAPRITRAAWATAHREV